MKKSVALKSRHFFDFSTTRHSSTALFDRKVQHKPRKKEVLSSWSLAGCLSIVPPEMRSTIIVAKSNRRHPQKVLV
jgi:hypothetical protein